MVRGRRGSGEGGAALRGRLYSCSIKIGTQELEKETEKDKEKAGVVLLLTPNPPTQQLCIMQNLFTSGKP